MLAVAGGKGGCGKTTTTLGLALAAVRCGGTALAVDADVDVPDLHRLAGVEDRPARNDEPRPAPASPGLAVLPAGPGTRPDDLRDRIAGTATYDRVLVDCPAGAGRDAAVPLRAADRTLLVTTPGRASLRDATKTAAMSRAVGTPVAGAVVTRSDRAPERVGSLLEAPVVEPVPAVEQPLRSRAVLRRYGRVLRRLEKVRIAESRPETGIDSHRR
jgi:septum site-determining protein MinD